MPTSHDVDQGYNAQALVDSRHQVILADQAFASQDHENLKPMVAGAKKTSPPSEWSLDLVLDGEGSLQNRFFDSLVGWFKTQPVTNINR
jgi:hypothetical protein